MMIHGVMKTYKIILFYAPPSKAPLSGYDYYIVGLHHAMLKQKAFSFCESNEI